MNANKFALKNSIFTNVNRVGLGCRNKANCPHVGPGNIGGMPSMRVFLTILIGPQGHKNAERMTEKGLTENLLMR